MRSRLLPLVALFALVLSACEPAEPLASWNTSESRDSIVSFVEAVTAKGSEQYVEPAERIAVFDNDGTLWAEQPMYFQLLFALDRVRTLAPEHPEWQTQEPFASILKGDIKKAMSGGKLALMDVVTATHSGMTSEEFAIVVQDWLATARHPVTNKPYTAMVYQPMLGLLDYLRANGFKVYIVSGGGTEFMRPWTEAVYGIPPEQVIGSRMQAEFATRDDVPEVVSLPEMASINDGPVKPVNIRQIIGRRPLAAFGNSDGDLQMLQWTMAGEGPRFALYVHHTDAEREWAYDRDSSIGHFDKGLDMAQAKGWTIVDMKNDWRVVFPE